RVRPPTTNRLSHGLRKPRNRKLCRFWLLSPIKVSSTPFELAFLDVGLCGTEAKSADLLPVGIRRGTLAYARNLQDLLAQRHLIRRQRYLRHGGTGKVAKRRAQGDNGGGSL